MRNQYKILVRKSGGKRPLQRPRCRWEDNIKLDSTFEAETATEKLKRYKSPGNDQIMTEPIYAQGKT
jgi:hypothetical protein